MMRSHIGFIAVAIVVVLCSSTTAQLENACRFDVPNLGISYDLSRLHQFLLHGYNDLYWDGDLYNYTFHVCSDRGTPCRTDANPSLRYAMFAQYQGVDDDPGHEIGKCHAVMAWWRGAPSKWEMIDPKDPSKGMSMFFDNGDECQGGKTRQLRVNFECYENADPRLPDYHFMVQESAPGSCDYTITIPAFDACPVIMCTDAPLDRCNSLNRESCHQVANKCGGCQFGYEAEDGSHHRSPGLSMCVEKSHAMGGGWVFLIVVLVTGTAFLMSWLAYQYGKRVGSMYGTGGKAVNGSFSTKYSEHQSLASSEASSAANEL